MNYRLPDGLIYLDGNSLGPPSEGVAARIADVVTREWGQGLIRSWNLLPDSGGGNWIDLARRVGDRIAPLIGAGPGEVSLGDSTSVSLFKTMVAAARLRPGRSVILVESGTFPTDGYVAAGVAELLGLTVRWCDPHDRAHLAAALDDDVALVSLTQVDFRSGAALDVAAITAAAHDVGALAQWDLCHSVGALPVDISSADFAVGCTYKYLNGGPGSPAFIWVHPTHVGVVQQPITGWMGHASPFAMAREYTPAPGIGRMRSGTPPVLALSVLDTALDAFDEVTLDELRTRSLALTDLFIVGLDSLGLEVITPREHARRGSQVSFRHEQAYGVVAALIARGVIGDYRDDGERPGIARFGFAPLYLTEYDVTQALAHLGEVLANDEHLNPAYAERNPVT